jgi:hypothetical protein
VGSAVRVGAGSVTVAGVLNRQAAAMNKVMKKSFRNGDRIIIMSPINKIE